MVFARILCTIGLSLGILMIICPAKVFKMQNSIRSIFMIPKLEIGDFKVGIYRSGGIFEVFIFTLLLTQTFTI